MKSTILDKISGFTRIFSLTTFITQMEVVCSNEIYKSRTNYDNITINMDIYCTEEVGKKKPMLQTQPIQY